MNREDTVREAFADLLLSIIKGLKVLTVYIIPSVIAAFLLSSEFRDYISGRPELGALVPSINFAAIVLADMIKKHLPDSGVDKIL